MSRDTKVDEPINLSGGVIAERAPKFYREVMANGGRGLGNDSQGLIFELVGEISRGKKESRATARLASGW